MERLPVQPIRSKKSDTDSKQRVKKETMNIMVFHYTISREKVIIITSKHGTMIFLPITILL